MVMGVTSWTPWRWYRAWLFIVQRLRELADPTAAITRRCPTLNVRPASLEAASLAHTHHVERILRSALRVVSSGMIDPVFDAIRHRQRAMKTDDMESRFVLLWLGIERMIVGTRDYGRCSKRRDRSFQRPSPCESSAGIQLPWRQPSISLT